MPRLSRVVVPAIVCRQGVVKNVALDRLVEDATHTYLTVSFSVLGETLPRAVDIVLGCMNLREQR